MNLVHLGVQFSFDVQSRSLPDGTAGYQTVAKFHQRDEEHQITVVRYKEPLTQGILVGRLRIDRKEGGGYYTQLVVNQCLEASEYLSLNSVIVAGNCGQDPDIKYFESGRCKANVSLAVKRSKTETDWVNIEVWGKTAQTFADYVRKGTQIAVQGSLKFETWNDRNSGEQRSKAVIVGDRFEFLGSKNANQSEQMEATPTAQYTQGISYDDVYF